MAKRNYNNMYAGYSARRDLRERMEIAFDAYQEQREKTEKMSKKEKGITIVMGMLLGIDEPDSEIYKKLKAEDPEILKKLTESPASVSDIVKRMAENNDKFEKEFDKQKAAEEEAWNRYDRLERQYNDRQAKKVRKFVVRGTGLAVAGTIIYGLVTGDLSAWLGTLKNAIGADVQASLQKPAAAVTATAEPTTEAQEQDNFIAGNTTASVESVGPVEEANLLDFINPSAAANFINQSRQGGTYLYADSGLSFLSTMNIDNLTPEQLSRMLPPTATFTDVIESFLTTSLEIGKIQTVSSIANVGVDFDNVFLENDLQRDKNLEFLNVVQEYINKMVTTGKIDPEFEKFINSVYIEKNNEYTFGTSTATRFQALNNIYVVTFATNRFLSEETCYELFGPIDEPINCFDSSADSEYAQLAYELIQSMKNKLGAIEVYDVVSQTALIDQINSELQEYSVTIDKTEIIKQIFSKFYKQKNGGKTSLPDGKLIDIGDGKIGFLPPQNELPDGATVPDQGDYKDDEGNPLPDPDENGGVVDKNGQAEYDRGKERGKTGEEALEDGALYLQGYAIGYAIFLSNNPTDITYVPNPTPTTTPAPTVPAEPSPESSPEPSFVPGEQPTQIIDGKTYVLINGDWIEVVENTQSTQSTGQSTAETTTEQSTMTTQSVQTEAVQTQSSEQVSVSAQSTVQGEITYEKGWALLNGVIVAVVDGEGENRTIIPLPGVENLNIQNTQTTGQAYQYTAQQ